MPRIPDYKKELADGLRCRNANVTDTRTRRLCRPVVVCGKQLLSYSRHKNRLYLRSSTTGCFISGDTNA
jgi:hypothetical protein